jgi:hypothetical protein
LQPGHIAFNAFSATHDRDDMIHGQFIRREFLSAVMANSSRELLFHQPDWVIPGFGLFAGDMFIVFFFSIQSVMVFYVLEPLIKFWIGVGLRPAS